LRQAELTSIQSENKKIKRKEGGVVDELLAPDPIYNHMVTPLFGPQSLLKTLIYILCGNVP